MVLAWTCTVISSKKNVTDINVHDTITIKSLITRLNFSNEIIVYFTLFYLQLWLVLRELRP